MSELHVVILAAGEGTRMKSRLPKVLHELAGRPLLAHVLDAAFSLRAAACHVVYGHGGERIPQSFDAGVRWVEQKRQLGTAHAVSQALPGIPDEARVLVLYGDVPLVRAETLAPLVAASNIALLTATLDDPSGYGRILRDARGRVASIVEDKDASPGQRAIREVNTGILAAPAASLKRHLPRIGKDNAKREHYLTDFVALAAAAGETIEAVAAADPVEVAGINDREQLAAAERAFQLRQARALMRAGLTLRDPARFDLRGALRCGADVVIDVDVVIEGEVALGDGVYVGPYSWLRNVAVAAGTRIESHCVLDSAKIGRNCRIGPYARIRPETKLADEVHIGNFVELKKTALGKGSKANHLAYLGDAAIGARVNVGAGVITCNYDGANKFRTIIGDGAFIGTDSQLVAPVRIGRGAYIAAGSTITKNAPAGALTVCRAREQKSVRGWKRPGKKT